MRPLFYGKKAVKKGNVKDFYHHVSLHSYGSLGYPIGNDHKDCRLFSNLLFTVRKPLSGSSIGSVNTQTRRRFYSAIVFQRIEGKTIFS